MLWEYLSCVIVNWDGDVVTMGDFNKVCDNSKRFGSVFNKHGVEAFNSFIASAGLVEVPLGGCSFTWCHISATKMSKLDRFLISDNLMCSCPSISSTSLDRYLSDHRQIIMREIHYDYGPIPFKFFHYWFEIDGFDKQEVVRLLQEVEKAESMEVAQKAKIKWSIEGDENSKYYHGVLNKKRGRLTICGVLVDERDFGNRITMEQNEDLEREVSKEEIKRAVWDCGIDKAPGPDGFTFGFYRRYWNLIENDVVDAVKWPISLIGSLYKIIAKVLANRLVTVLDDLVYEIQSAFVSDRQILDGPFNLNEIVQWCKNKKKQAMIFKVDFEKAYDSVRWDFIDDTLRIFGFGLKQVDPLSPFLFILAIESLHVPFQRVVDAGLFKGINLASSLQISHLFYADDAIFMGQWSQCNIYTITQVLDVFHRASGLRINMNKSKLMGISVDSSKVEQAAAKIGCMVPKTPFKYLGSRVSDLMSRIQSWNDVTEGMMSRLSRWKLKTLSIGGRLTLLKSVLGAIPIHHMSIFKVPMKVLHNMESIRSRFFNGADFNSKKPSWVRWNNVLASKDIGGLGVSSLFALNRALMFKWVWRFISQKTSLWARVIKALHGEDGKIGKKVQPCYPSIWLSIINEIKFLKSQGIDLLSFITLKLGNGVNTLFWDVAWCGDVAFKNLVPRLYALETMKSIEVTSKLSHAGLEFSFRRNPRGGVEQAQFELLKEKVEAVILSNANDGWRWSLVDSGEFSVLSVRKLIDDALLPKVNMKTRWIKAVPIKINVHAWKVKHDYLPTRFNISRRGMEIDSILCPMCDCTAESSRHLFFSCKFVSEIMRKITRWWDMEYKEINSFEDCLLWILAIRLPIKQKQVFEGICYVVWWYTWKWRNKKIFGQEAPSKANILDDVVSSSFYWIRF
ncbi:RNA-directed DNA polymerase, eukaryota, reverse transcriptase zinc-binding domain protein [Tanacetum coccineum]